MAAASGWRIYATAKRQRRPDHAAEPLESFTLASGDRVDALQLGDGSVFVPFDFDEAYQNYLSERWRVQTDLRALGESQLTLYYRVKRLLPRELQLALRRLFIRLRTTPAFPGLAARAIRRPAACASTRAACLPTPESNRPRSHGSGRRRTTAA